MGTVEPIKLETCTLVERYKFFSSKLNDYPSFDDFVIELQTKSSACHFLERENMIRDMIIMKTVEFGQEELLACLNDSLTLHDIINLCRDYIPLLYSTEIDFEGKVEADVVPDQVEDEPDQKPDLAESNETDGNVEDVKVFSNERVQCNFCEGTYKTQEYSNRHARRAHPEEYKQAKTVGWTCKLCQARFKKRKDYKQHEATCVESPIKTEIDVSNSTAERDDKYNCVYCGKRFKIIKDIEQHYRATHGQVQCGVCNKTFARVKGLWGHRQRHKERPQKLIKCQYCPKLCDRNNVRKHEDRHRFNELRKDPHADPLVLDKFKRKFLPKEKNVPCYICGKAFRFQKTLNLHLRSHAGVRNFACAKCPKRFLSNSTLKVHQQTHAEQPMFKCRFCDKFLKQKSYVATHEKRHLGIKSYSCPFCDKTFTCWASRRYHVRLHTGECPFKCTYCDKAFPQPNGLNSHMKIHMREKRVDVEKNTKIERNTSG